MVRTEIRPSLWSNAFSWCQIIVWPKTIKGQPALTHVIRNYVLLLVVPPLCLWWVTHIVTKALRLKILPRQQLPLFPNPPTLLISYQQLTSKQRHNKEKNTDGHNQLLKKKEKCKNQKKKYECTAVEITKCWNVAVDTFIWKNGTAGISGSYIRDEHKENNRWL